MVLLSVLNNKAVSVYLMIQNKLILTIRLEDTIFFEENRVQVSISLDNTEIFYDLKKKFLSPYPKGSRRKKGFS